MVLFKIIKLIIQNISSEVNWRLILYTFKTPIISQNESHLVWTLLAWNVLENFPFCKRSSSLQDPYWSSSPCSACAFLADSTCYWQCVFVLFLLRDLVLPYRVLLSFSGVSPVLYVASVSSVMTCVWGEVVSMFPYTSVPSDVLIAWCSIHFGFLNYKVPNLQLTSVQLYLGLLPFAIGCGRRNYQEGNCHNY